VSGGAYQSWGRIDFGPQSGVPYDYRCAPLPQTEPGKTVLPYGNGRSYGDSCLNTGGVLIDCRRLDRFISFDANAGVLRCEAGVLLADIVAVAVPRGWFLPVSPGTRFVTVGGAIANDVHGKNHHKAGTFGCYVRCFELLRSNGDRLLCSADENPDFFQATIGGLGLTGLVTWAEIQLKQVANAYIDQETIRFGDLAEFFDLSPDNRSTRISSTPSRGSIVWRPGRRWGADCSCAATMLQRWRAMRRRCRGKAFRCRSRRRSRW
jgi:hypothetical protein